jgi:hypothetical protein
MKHSTVAVLVCASVSGCATLDTWHLDDPAGDSVTIKRLEDRMDRFLKSAEIEGNPRDWYTVNGYYMVVRTPYHLRRTFRTRIPYVACSGVDNPTPPKIEAACKLVEPPVRAETTAK